MMQLVRIPGRHGRVDDARWMSASEANAPLIAE